MFRNWRILRRYAFRPWTEMGLPLPWFSARRWRNELRIARMAFASWVAGFDVTTWKELR